MKKTVYLLLTLALMFALCAVGAFADGAAMTLDACEAEPGAAISVPIRLVNNPGIISIELNIRYDTNALEWTGVQAGDYAGTIGDYELGVGQSIAWFAKDERTDITQDGVFATLSFKVKDGAAAQTTQIEIVYNEDDVFNADFDNVYFGVVPGTVTITAPSYSISFNANGGENAPAAISVAQGETATLPTTIPTREGYYFLGWAASADAEDAQYKAGESLTPSGNMTLYAVWLDLSAPDFKLPASIERIEDEAFAGTAVRYAALPENLLYLGNRIFAGCTKLIAVYAPSLVSDILPEAFADAPDTLVLLGQIASAIAEFAAQHGLHFEAVESIVIP